MHPLKALPLAAAAALAAAVPARMQERAATTSSAAITNASQMASVLQGIEEDGADAAMAAQELLGVLNTIVPLSSPATIPAALARLGQLYAQNYKGLFMNGASILLDGLAGGDAQTILAGETYQNSDNNTNPPIAGLYPYKSSSDAPYDVSEAALRAAIYIPANFTYGKVRPLIFVPGTAGYAAQNFAPNAGKLFKADGTADPVYLNIPGAQLDDIQTNAEYVAYAINYVAALTGTKPSLMTWSAGAIAARWANKYWPSTRTAVTNGVTVSADFHGTTLAYGLDPAFPRSPTPPSVVQQGYNSTFIATLRNNGGESPFYPLTTVFGAFDEIVEPQGGTGVENASGYSSDKNGVGVTNLYVQGVCSAETPGGAPNNDHEGLLYNALAIAAARDALRSGKNANLSNFNATAQCFKFAADGMSLPDILATEATIPIAAMYILAYPNKTATEPVIKPYAVKDIPPGYCNGC